MTARTPKEEVKFLQALGYAWGRKDATPYASAKAQDTLKTGSVEFATFYVRTSEWYTLEKAWDYFTKLTYDEQQAYYATWKMEPATYA